MAQGRGGSRFFYPNRRYAPYASAGGGDVERGLNIGKQIGGLLGGLGGAIKEAQQNKIANQLMDQAAIANQPGAGVPQDLGTLPADTGAAPDDNWQLPDTSGPVQGAGDDTVGSLIHTGGVDEMKLRQQFEKENLANQIGRARLENTGPFAKRAAAVRPGVTVTGGGSSSRWLEGGQGGQGGQGRGGKPAPYQAGTGDIENDESTDNFSQIRADFDDQHGKGSFDAFQAQNGGIKDEKTGNYSIVDKSDNPIATVQAADVPLWMQRVNAARLKRGQSPIGDLGSGQNPASTAPVGSATNPVIAQSKVHVRSLPYGTYVYDPNTGATYIKQRPQGQ